MFGPCPNISGSWSDTYVAQQSAGAGGAAYFNASVHQAVTLKESPQGTPAEMRFEASRSASIYAGSLMQPAALQVLACIRI